MRPAIIFVSSVLALTSGLDCPTGWVVYDDASGTEYTQSCLFFGQTPLRFAEANKFCQEEGAHLLSIASTDSYGGACAPEDRRRRLGSSGGLLDFVLDYEGCDPAESTCSRYWTAARIPEEANTGGAAEDNFAWKGDRFGFNKKIQSTPTTNLECEAGTCIWGTYDDPTDDSDNDPNSYPFPDKERCPGCNWGALGIQYGGLANVEGDELLKFVCEIEADSDKDGVPDDVDFCPDTINRANQKLDQNGCRQYQIDPDNDNFCSSTFPEVTLGVSPLESSLCRLGVDNCDFVKNGNQDPAACDASLCAEDSNCAVGCNVSGSKKCLFDVDIDDGKIIPDFAGRCVAPANPVKSRARGATRCRL